MVLESGMLSGSSWGGSISPDEFHIAALAFAERWEKCNSSLSQWSWVSPKRLGVAADNVSIFWPVLCYVSESLRSSVCLRCSFYI